MLVLGPSGRGRGLVKLKLGDSARELAGFRESMPVPKLNPMVPHYGIVMFRTNVVWVVRIVITIVRFRFGKAITNQLQKRGF